MFLYIRLKNYLVLKFIYLTELILFIVRKHFDTILSVEKPETVRNLCKIKMTIFNTTDFATGDYKNLGSS